MKNIRYWSIVDAIADNSEEVLISSYDRNGHANVHRINVFTGEKEDLFNSRNLKANSLYMNREAEVVLATREKKGNVEYFRIADIDNKDPVLASVDIAGSSYKLGYNGRTFLGRNVLINGFGYEKDIVYISENVSDDNRIIMPLCEFL